MVSGMGSGSRFFSASCGDGIIRGKYCDATTGAALPKLPRVASAFPGLSEGEGRRTKGRLKPAATVLKPFLANLNGLSCASVSATTMLRLTEQQRTALGETLRGFANLEAGALVLTQFVGERPTSWPLILVGMGAWVALVGLALLLLKRRSDG